MPTASEFDLTARLELDALPRDLHNGVPAGLKRQVEELASIVGQHLAEDEAINASPRLTPAGKDDDKETAVKTHSDAVAQWATKVDTISRHATALQERLTATEAASIPAPSDLRIQLMVQRLSALDSLEVLALYHGSDPIEQKTMEIASASVGKLPVKRANGVTWEPLLPPEIIATTVAARARQTDPALANQLDDLVRIQRLFQSLAATARKVITSTLPRTRTTAAV